MKKLIPYSVYLPVEYHAKIKDLAKQRLGIQEIERQTVEFKKRFRNLRIAAWSSALFFGQIALNPKAPHPNAAKLAANFLLSREAQHHSSQNGGRIPTRADVESNPKDVRERLGQKKIVFLMQNPEETKASQRIFDEIFRPR